MSHVIDGPMDGRGDMGVSGCMPSVIDAELLQRVSSGMSTDLDAVRLAGLKARFEHYERALSHIVVHGDTESARVAMLAYMGGTW